MKKAEDWFYIVCIVIGWSTIVAAAFNFVIHIFQ